MTLELFRKPSLLDSFFNDLELSRRGAIVPAVDIRETPEGFHFKFDLPGVNKKDINVEVKDNYLTISGEKRSEVEEKKEGYHRIERSFGKFQRSFDIPHGVDTGKLKASYTDGVLDVFVSKSQATPANKVLVE